MRLALPSPSSMTGYFQFLDTVLNVTSDHSCCIVSFSALKIFFAKLILAKYRSLHKKPCIFFMSSVTTESLYKSLFYKFFCTNLSQVVLRRFYTERLLCNMICVALICLISSFHANLKRQNSSDLLRIVSSTLQCRKLPRFHNLDVQIS